MDKLTGKLSSHPKIIGTAETSEKLTGTLEAVGTLTGELSSKASLTGTLSGVNGLEGVLNNPDKVYVYDYHRLENKPSINAVELYDDKSFEELGVYELTNTELEEITEW